VDLPTYTSIWRIEKRLYKLYDFRLPMPVPVGQIAVFAAITVPYVILLTILGLPFNHSLFWLYVLPPGVITWLATRPVLESKRLPELIISQVRYLGEPVTWCRMAPLAEKDDVVVIGKVWRRDEERPRSPAAAPALAPAVAPDVARRPARVRPAAARKAAATQAAPSGPPARVPRAAPARRLRRPAEQPARLATWSGSVPAPADASTAAAADTAAAEVAQEDRQAPMHPVAAPAGRHAARPGLPASGPGRPAGEGEGVTRHARPGGTAVGWPSAAAWPVKDPHLPAAPLRPAWTSPDSTAPVSGNLGWPTGPAVPAAADRVAAAGDPVLVEGDPVEADPVEADGTPLVGRADSLAPPDTERPAPPAGPAVSVPAQAAPPEPAVPSAGPAGFYIGAPRPEPIRDSPALQEPDGDRPSPPGSVPDETAVPAAVSEAAGFQVAGPEAVEDQAAEPEVVEEQTAEPEVAQHEVPPDSAEPDVAAAEAAEPEMGAGATAAEADPAEMAAPGVAEPELAEPDVAEPDALDESGTPAETDPPVTADDLAGPEDLPTPDALDAPDESPRSEGLRDDEAPDQDPPDEAADPAAGPPAPSPSPWAPPIVVVRGGSSTRPTMVERALSGPGQHRAGSNWREHVRVVPGGHGPGRPDMERRDRARVLLPVHSPRLIVVLGCTVGAGQTVTTLMLADVLASLRGEPVAALDLNPGQTSLTDMARTSPAASARGLLAGPTPTVPGQRGRGRLDLIAHDSTPDGGSALADEEYARVLEILTSRYPLTLTDPGASAVARVLSAADQLVLVAPASADAARAVAMTMEWLDGHGYEELCTGAITVINGVSKRSMSHVEQAELVVRGRCRAIVRVPWDDHLGAPPTEQGISDAATADAESRFAQLRPQVQLAYTALAGVLVSALAVGGSRAAPPGAPLPPDGTPQRWVSR